MNKSYEEFLKDFQRKVFANNDPFTCRWDNASSCPMEYSFSRRLTTNGVQMIYAVNYPVDDNLPFRKCSISEYQYLFAVTAEGKIYLYYFYGWLASSFLPDGIYNLVPEKINKEISEQIFPEFIDQIDDDYRLSDTEKVVALQKAREYGLEKGGLMDPLTCPISYGAQEHVQHLCGLRDLRKDAKCELAAKKETWAYNKSFRKCIQGHLDDGDYAKTWEKEIAKALREATGETVKAVFEADGKRIEAKVERVGLLSDVTANRSTVPEIHYKPQYQYVNIMLSTDRPGHPLRCDQILELWYRGKLLYQRSEEE